MKKCILIVDDEKINRQGLERALYTDYKIYLTESAEEAVEFLKNQTVDLVLTDVRMTGMNGIEFIKHVSKHYPQIKSLVMTAYGSIELAIQAIKNGAYDFISKPIDLDNLFNILQQMSSTPQNIPPKINNEFPEYETNSHKMKNLLSLVHKVAGSNATILLSGESGTGKEIMAQYIHKISNRHEEAFIATHCASLNINLLESELFGHKKGSFTGAIENKIGRFQQAHKGTLFLDEIGEINQDIQIKLLRVLETRNFEPVGSSEQINVDIRIITATNKNLHEMVKAKIFREDLYYRLNVINIELPSLKERKEDIIPLTKQFIKTFNQQQNKSVKHLSKTMEQALLEYSWPGNIRELKNIIEKMVLLSETEELNDTSFLPKTHFTKEAHSESLNVQKNEKKLISNALNKYSHNKSLVAEKLGISRRTLYRKLKQFNLE